MSVYSERDIAINFDGDLEIGAGGDIVLSNSFDTQKAAVNWLLRTNKGEYQPDVRLGCDVGTFIGKTMTNSIINNMEGVVLSNLVKFIISRSDVRVDIIPIAHDELALLVSIAGKYLGDDGNLLDSGQTVLKYVFPYLEGSPTPVL